MKICFEEQPRINYVTWSAVKTGQVVRSAQERNKVFMKGSDHGCINLCSGRVVSGTDMITHHSDWKCEIVEATVLVQGGVE